MERFELMLWSTGFPHRLWLLLFTRSLMSNSLRPHGLQHTGFPCPSPSHGVCSSSCPLSQWCHPTILSSVIPFTSCPQSFLSSEYFPMSQLFSSDGQTIGASASASVLLMNIQGWFALGLTGLISLLSKGFSSLLQHHSLKHQFFHAQPSLQLTLTSIYYYWENHSFD